MKNQSIILLLILLIMIASFSAFAQVTVNSTGSVGIATSIQSGSTISLSNNVLFYHGYYPGLKIDASSSNCNYGLTFYPTTHNSGNLGKSDKAFSHIYSAGGNVEISDARQKENIRKIESGLDLIMKVDGVKYDIKKLAASVRGPAT